MSYHHVTRNQNEAGICIIDLNVKRNLKQGYGVKDDKSGFPIWAKTWNDKEKQAVLLYAHVVRRFSAMQDVK